MAIESTLSLLKGARVVPVIRATDTRLADLSIQYLQELGFQTVEITLTTPGALGLIEKYSKQSNLLVGAGTVLSLEDVHACIEVGAKYIVSPTLLSGMADICHQADVLAIMSGLTPTEIQQAWNEGSDIVKIFPAESMGGVNYLKTLKTIFPHIPMIPTGGINSENMNDFFEAGIEVIGVGSNLVNVSIIHNKEEFIQNGLKYLQNINNGGIMK